MARSENDIITDPNLNRTLALAGVFQAARLVLLLANRGKIMQPYFQSTLESLLKIDAKDTSDVFGNIANVRLGLNTVVDLFSENSGPKDSDIARYALSMLHLERKLSKNKNLLNIISTGLARVQLQMVHYGITHENVLANLAGIYSDTVSTFRFKIFVTGEEVYINQTSNMNKIRALLLAGIRAAVLWRQLNGHRWQLLFSRASILSSAKRLLAKTEVMEEV